MPVEHISGAVEAVSQLLTVIIQHIDKTPEDRRLLNLQSINHELVKLSADLEALIHKVQSE